MHTRSIYYITVDRNKMHGIHSLKLNAKQATLVTMNTYQYPLAL